MPPPAAWMRDPLACAATSGVRRFTRATAVPTVAWSITARSAAEPRKADQPPCSAARASRNTRATRQMGARGGRA